MLAKLFEVKDAGDKGKGLFAKEQIPKGTIISFECQDCIRISKQDFESILPAMKRVLSSDMLTEKLMDLIYFHAMKSFI